MKPVARSLVLVALFCLLCLPAQAAVIHVPAGQPTIQDGIDAAVAGDTVLVADGTYFEQIDFLGKAITVASANGPASCIIDGGGSGTVVTLQSFEGTDSVLEGFTITNGELGVSILGEYDVQTSGATVRDNVITANTSASNGGGIYGYWSVAVIEGNVISGNTALRGAGIYAQVSDLVIEQNEVTGNTATNNSGGGLSIRDCTGEIRGNTISGNSAPIRGGGLYMDGRLIPLPPPLVVGNVISGNESQYHGGGCYLTTAEGTQIRDNIITDNTAVESGGGVYGNSTVSWSLVGNRITGNSANEGGGLFNEEGDVEVSNNLFADNTAELRGGAIKLAGMVCTMQNTTIVNNQANDAHGGAIHAFNASLVGTNNILYFNSARFNVSKEIYFAGGALFDLSYGDLEGGESTVYVENPGLYTWGPGMIDADPLLLDGPNGMACLSQTAAGQAADSPCLDAGSGLATLTGYDTDLGEVTMDQMSTRTDQLHDSGTVDMGWHNKGWPSSTLSASFSVNPPSGSLPFSAQFTAGLTNRYLAQTRRVAVRINADLAGGLHFTNWRAGWTNLERGDVFSKSWPQYFPALGNLVGDNEFTLTAADVTPAPYNQPPYPPSGDTDEAGCTVTGVAP